LNFALSPEQELLCKTAREVLANAACLSIAQVRALNRTGAEAEGAGATHFSVAADLDDTELWAQLAELGFLGLPFATEHGGGDGSFMDLAVLLEEMGRATGPPAYTQTVALCGLTLHRWGSPVLRDEWIPRIVEGTARLSLALVEQEGVETPAGIQMRAQRDGDGYILDGVKRHVEEGGRSDALLVVARAPGGSPVFLLVDRDSPGIILRPQRTVAGGDRVDVLLDSVNVPASRLVGTEDAGELMLEELWQRGAVATCLDMVGGAAAVLEMSVAYAAEREQFGRKIGSFQAVQHHAANMAVDVDASRLITYQAAWALSVGQHTGMETAMAKAWTGEAYRRVCTLGHQIFGGIGLMREHDMHLFLRRSRRDELAFGDTAAHQDRLAAILDIIETPWPLLRGHSLGPAT